MKTPLLVLAFASTVPAANWLIGNVGTECIPNGPCLIPVGLGLHAPSGVLMIGLALVLRDAVHEAGGLRAALLAIVIGAGLSWLVAPPALVLASVAAFALAELADLSVYTPLRKRQLSLAVLASGMVGAVIDSAVFLWLAFGSLDFMAGQIVGKLWMSAIAALALFVWPSAEEWGVDGDPDVAACIGGHYIVTASNSLIRWFEGARANLGNYDTKPEAKAAAQSDHSARILSALSPGKGETDWTPDKRTVEMCAAAAYSDPHYVNSLDRDKDGLLQPGSPYDRGAYDARKRILALLPQAQP